MYGPELFTQTERSLPVITKQLHRQLAFYIGGKPGDEAVELMDIARKKAVIPVSWGLSKQM